MDREQLVDGMCDTLPHKLILQVCDRLTEVDHLRGFAPFADVDMTRPENLARLTKIACVSLNGIAGEDPFPDKIFLNPLDGLGFQRAEVVNPAGLTGLLDSTASDILVVGDHQALPDETLRGLHRVKTGRPRWPSADVLLELAAGRIARGELAAPEEVRPLYLREPDVAINWQDFREEATWKGD